jgi:hypothetical protein
MRGTPARARTVAPCDDAIVEGGPVFVIEDAAREQIADALATLFLAVLAREAAGDETKGAFNDRP